MSLCSVEELEKKKDWSLAARCTMSIKASLGNRRHVRSEGALSAHFCDKLLAFLTSREKLMGSSPWNNGSLESMLRIFLGQRCFLSIKQKNRNSLKCYFYRWVIKDLGFSLVPTLPSFFNICVERRRENLVCKVMWVISHVEPWNGTASKTIDQQQSLGLSWYLLGSTCGFNHWCSKNCRIQSA